MNRIDRLSAILILLQTKKIIRAEDIADRFEISKRTVYRDIRSLEEAGIPIGAEAGLGYYLIEGYHLPPVMFTKEEAGAFITASKLVEKFTDCSLNQKYNLALDKIKSVLRDEDKEHLENLTPNIHIYQHPIVSSNKFPENCISIIQEALADKKVLKFDYIAAYNQKQTSDRLVEPIGLCYYGFTWHLIGYCRLRNDYRDFRLDRMQKIQATKEIFQRTKEKTFKEYINSLYQSEDLQPVTIRFDKSIIEFIERPKYYYGYVDENNLVNEVEMYFMIDSLEYISRWILCHGNKATIIKPIELKDKVKDLVKDLTGHYL